MPNPLNETNIIAPRVPLIDERSGLISREWYRFFLNLFVLTGGGRNDTSLLDLQVGPPTQPQLDLHNINPEPAGLAAYAAGSVQESQIAELQKQIQALALDNCCAATISELAQVQKQLQAFAVTPQSQLGTMAALQQDNVPWLQFDTTPAGMPTGVAANGTVYWDDADSIKTLNIVMEDSGEVIQHVGEETYYRVKASATITKGQVVMFTGTVGASGGLRGAPATGLTAFQSEYVLGIATQNIANNGWGYVTWFGEVKKVNTTGGAETWVDGQILYYNPAVAGGLTKNVPTAPNPKVIVAAVVHAATNGVLFVRPTFGSALGQTDSNVEIAGLANGDLLQYDSGQARWENVPASSVIAGTASAPVTKTADFTVAAGETWFINNKSGSTCVVTLPVASSWTGRTLTFKNMQAQLLNSASSNVVPINSTSAGTAILLNVIGNWATMVSDGTNWVIMQQAPNNILLLE